MLQINVKKAAILLFSIMSFVQGQVNIEAMRDTNDNSSLELQFDLDFINTTKKNTEFTYATRYNYLFENEAVFLGVFKGEYFQQETDGIKQDLENKGMLHLRYTHPVKSFYVEGFIQNEFDDFRSLENRQLFGGGVRFPLTSSSFFDSMFLGSGVMYEKEVYKLDNNLEITELKSTNYLTLSKAIKNNISLSTTMYYQFNTSKVKDYRLLAISTINFDISDRVGFFVRIDLREQAIPVDNSLDYNYAEVSLGMELNL
jgi:hypothetical protein